MVQSRKCKESLGIISHVCLKFYETYVLVLRVTIGGQLAGEGEKARMGGRIQPSFTFRSFNNR